MSLTAVITAKIRWTMKTFTIDAESTITVHNWCKAAKETGTDVFATEEQLVELIVADGMEL